MANQLQQARLPPFADTLLAQFKSHAKAHVDAASPQASRVHSSQCDALSDMQHDTS